MFDADNLYEEILSIWPVKRTPSERELDKKAIVVTVKDESDAVALKGSIEFKVEDLEAFRLPPLLSLILGFKKADPIKSVVPVVLETVSIEEEKTDGVEEAFEEILAAWPENDIPQNENNARVAFVAACRQHQLEEIKRACSRYIDEMNDPLKASTHVLGIKRFVSDDDILDNWIQKADKPISNYDSKYFDAAYAAYPEFFNKEDSRSKDESLSFYKRFVKEEDCIDFWCAVSAYNTERKDDSRKQQFRSDYDPEDGIKFTKKFVSFIRTWKDQDRVLARIDLLEPLIIISLKKSKVPYHHVYPVESFRSALGWCCQTEEGIPAIVNKMVENICNYLTSGKNGDNIVIPTKVDYSIVSEIVASAKSFVGTIPQKGRLIESE